MQSTTPVASTPVLILGLLQHAKPGELSSHIGDSTACLKGPHCPLPTSQLHLTCTHNLDRHPFATRPETALTTDLLQLMLLRGTPSTQQLLCCPGRAAPSPSRHHMPPAEHGFGC